MVLIDCERIITKDSKQRLQGVNQLSNPLQLSMKYNEEKQWIR